MKSLRSFILTLKAALLLTIIASAQTPGKIENFTLINAINHNSISLSDYKNEKAIVLIFTSNYCPFAKLYEERIQNLISQYQGKGAQFLLINSNTSLDHLDDSIEEMAKWAKEKNAVVPYLADKEQKVALQFKATKNPEVFVLQNTGEGNFILKYRGAIDDNPQVAQEATAFYLRDAITAAVNRKNLSYAEKRPVGCAIQKQ
ncbi:thioredoxin family protein [Xanthocytophaga flava]|uniref:thioredoxin family protein n=1 Tax=Xanthocytophaga flava TaxID=3048013 RepID=UPI0028D0C954|nr:thioredoxin family protein [Xanthocytophaga flavus]MDJ1467704.1 thioredoxin family protein [Xanthocytophaga flavus]